MSLSKELNPQFLPRVQEKRLLTDAPIQANLDYDRIYRNGIVQLGWPKDAVRIFDPLAKDNTAGIIGAMLGDEGKGRIVDNKIEALLTIPGVKKVTVVRFNGGNNAGHTVEGLDFHVVPSIMHPQTVGIIDQGVVIHAEDLKTEVNYVEDVVGDTRGKLYVSDRAILCTDIERAEETLNGGRSKASQGGTGRGIAPSYAHRLERTGKRVRNLMSENWKEEFAEYYVQKQKYFSSHGEDMANVLVPDFRLSHEKGESISRPLGSKNEFLDRLESARTWLIERNIVDNTLRIHKEIIKDTSENALILEGGQAEGLHPWLGTYPDVTASDPSIYGITTGTGLWTPQDIKERIGVFKATYTSDVGMRHLNTQIDLPKDIESLPDNATKEQKWAAWIVKEGREYGTTTRRPRRINYLDIPMLKYNARMSGIETLVATHLDLARENEVIKVCTYYTDKSGKVVGYEPDLEYLADVSPHYMELPGWDGTACQKAKNYNQLPENSVKYLALIQARTGFPIVAATTGPARENFIAFSGWQT
jgi:adenylosuccinate synthase